jgi:small nuclear ribonucleoprotein (snRNP)-like protein
MKKLLFLLIALLPLIASAQNGQSVVTLKNGTELKGTIKAIDPTDALTIVIAGVEAKIKMSDVARIEEANQAPVSVPTAAAQPQLGEKDKLLVTDNADYPETFDLKVGNESIKMILVRGGDMNMGFDGKGSRAMKSEPVHKVGVTSFYMSENFITSKVVSEVTDKSSKKEFYTARKWKNANQIVESIAKIIGMPVRLPTEAEWEYAACSSMQDIIFNKCKGFEFIYDFFDEFKDIEYRVDPTGPKNGFFHVIRAYERSKGKLDRSDCFGESENNEFRVVVKVKDVIDNIK